MITQKHVGFISDKVIDNSYLNAGGLIDVTKQCGVKNPLPCIGKKKAECLAKKAAFETCASAVRAGVASSMGVEVTPTERQEKTINEQLGINQQSDPSALMKGMESAISDKTNKPVNSPIQQRKSGMKIGLIIGVVVVVGVIGFLVYRKMKK